MSKTWLKVLSALLPIGVIALIVSFVVDNKVSVRGGVSTYGGVSMNVDVGNASTVWMVIGFVLFLVGAMAIVGNLIVSAISTPVDQAEKVGRVNPLRDWYRQAVLPPEHVAD